MEPEELYWRLTCKFPCWPQNCLRQSALTTVKCSSRKHVLLRLLAMMAAEAGFWEENLLSNGACHFSKEIWRRWTNMAIKLDISSRIWEYFWNYLNSVSSNVSQGHTVEVIEAKELMTLVFHCQGEFTRHPLLLSLPHLSLMSWRITQEFGQQVNSWPYRSPKIIITGP